MADIFSRPNLNKDDCDVALFDQFHVDTEGFSPLCRVKKYYLSKNVCDRKAVIRLVQETFHTAPTEILTEELHDIMKIVRSIGEEDDAIVKTDLLEQIPQIALQALACSHRVDSLKTIVSDYLIPVIINNLDLTENALDKVASTTLLQLLEQNLITKQQVEIQICPTILALSNDETSDDINTGIITLMSRMAPLLGRDITERVFLPRFVQLCSNLKFFIRNICASRIGNMCAVVGEDKVKNVLLPCFISLCQDNAWSVRKSCAEVMMLISALCPLEIRHTTLAPIYVKLLKDECHWVQLAAYQNLGPFIATFADPSITDVAYNQQRELVFVDKNGNEFSSQPVDVKLFNYVPAKQPSDNDNHESGLDQWYSDKNPLFSNMQLTTSSDNNNKMKDNNINSDCLDSDVDINYSGDNNQQSTIVTNTITCNDNDDNNNINNNGGGGDLPLETFGNNEDPELVIHDIVESVKNAVLLLNEKKNDTINDNLIKQNNTNNCDKSNLCDNLNSSNNAINKLKCKMSKLDINYYNNENLETIPEKNNNNINTNNNNDVDNSNNNNNINNNNNNINNNNNNKENETDDLIMYNSYNYWYISPEMPVDLNIVDDFKDTSESSDSNVSSDDSSSRISIVADPSKPIYTFKYLKPTSDSQNPPQTIVPQVLIDNFVLMSDTSYLLYSNIEMSYYCAYSIPAVVLTLGRKNWPLLKRSVEKLASDVQFKIRRTIASCLHELASILGTDITTRDLTPIFEGFIKDLDEIRVGVLRNLAKFLFWVKPAKRRTYLPRLSEFYDDINWRFRHELARQLMLSVPLFKPKDLTDIAVIADYLLDDSVAAVRQVAISLVTELTRYFSKIPGINSRWLVVLSETCAHSKKWKRRQTFASLCYSLLSVQSLAPEQFATDIMPHLLDLSWDPVANVRLVVARTISKHIVTNEYFSDPHNQYYDSLGTVLRHLLSDKDRDVRQAAEGYENHPSAQTFYNKVSAFEQHL